MCVTVMDTKILFSHNFHVLWNFILFLILSPIKKSKIFLSLWDMQKQIVGGICQPLI